MHSTRQIHATSARGESDTRHKIIRRTFIKLLRTLLQTLSLTIRQITELSKAKRPFSIFATRQINRWQGTILFCQSHRDHLARIDISRFLRTGTQQYIQEFFSNLQVTIYQTFFSILVLKFQMLFQLICELLIDSNWN